jgi:hypothetical protein
MGTRVIIGIEPQVDWATLKQELAQAGALGTSDPSPARPDAVVAEVPDGAEVQAFIERTRQLPGVRYAEPDAWVSTGPPVQT